MNQAGPPRLSDDLWDAVEVLALRRGSIAQRLSSAYHDHIVQVDPKALPIGLRQPFEQLCAEFRIELAKVQSRLDRLNILLRPAEAGNYIHHAAARGLAKNIVNLSRQLANELEVWVNRNSYSSPPNIKNLEKRLGDAGKRRQKALKRSPIESQLMSGTNYLTAADGESAKRAGKETAQDKATRK